MENAEPKLLLEWWNEPLPDVTWLVEGILPGPGALVMMSGPPKLGYKTWLAMTLAGLTASGGGYKNLRATKAAPTLFIEEEGTRPGTRARVGKALRMLGIDLDNPDSPEAQNLAKNFFFEHHPRLKLDNPLHVNQVMRWIEKYRVDLVVLDAITYMHNGDENEMQDMQKVNDALSAFRSKGATVLYLVHMNRSSQRETADIDLGTRGSSVLIDKYDAHFGLRRNKKTGDLHLTLRFRDYEERQFFVFWDIPKGGNSAELILKEISEEHEGSTYHEVLLRKYAPGAEISMKEFIDALGISRGDAMRIKTSMLNDELISLEGKNIIL